LLADADQIDAVDFVSYSFDVKDLTDALCHLGAKVRILMDWSMCFGKTKKQPQQHNSSLPTGAARALARASQSKRLTGHGTGK
jgi:hypothetical protein